MIDRNSMWFNLCDVWHSGDVRMTHLVPLAVGLFGFGGASGCDSIEHVARSSPAPLSHSGPTFLPRSQVYRSPFWCASGKVISLQPTKRGELPHAAIGCATDWYSHDSLIIACCMPRCNYSIGDDPAYVRWSRQLVDRCR